MSLEEIIQAIAHNILGNNIFNSSNLNGNNIFEMVSWIGDDQISRAMLRFVLRIKIEELEDKLLYFTEDEFEYHNKLGEPPNTPDFLRRKIEENIIDISIKYRCGSIEWLNELLETPNFYDKYKKAKDERHRNKQRRISGSNGPFATSGGEITQRELTAKEIETLDKIETLAAVTNNCRSMNFQDLEYYHRRRIIELNRLLLETNYKSAPKRRGANIIEAIKSSYQTSYDGMPFSDKKAMYYCWDIAESLVDILVNYDKYNGQPDFKYWSDIVQDEHFAEFVASLYMVTKGEIDNRVLDESALEFIKNKYNDQHESLSSFIFATECINIHMKWIVERYPNNPIVREDASRHLFNWCAELIKYTYIATAGDDRIGIDSSCPEDILLWNPSKALAALCSSYNKGVPDEYSFCLDSFWQVMESVCDNIMGGSDLLWIYYKNIDSDTREGALKLIAEHNWEQIDIPDILKLVKSISASQNGKERLRYASLLPSVEEFSKRAQDENTMSTYREHLEKCLSKTD